MHYVNLGIGYPIPSKKYINRKPPGGVWPYLHNTAMALISYQVLIRSKRKEKKGQMEWLFQRIVKEAAALLIQFLQFMQLCLLERYYEFYGSGRWCHLSEESVITQGLKISSFFLTMYVHFIWLFYLNILSFYKI